MAKAVYPKSDNLDYATETLTAIDDHLNDPRTYSKPTTGSFTLSYDLNHLRDEGVEIQLNEYHNRVEFTMPGRAVNFDAMQQATDILTRELGLDEGEVTEAIEGLIDTANIKALAERLVKARAKR